MQPFTLVVPHDLAEAAAAGQKPNAAFKAGGIDLLDRLKERLEPIAEVVNLLPLRASMQTIDTDAGALRLGALATLHEVAAHAALQGKALAALREAAATTATPQVRNRATLAGNLVQKARCWYLRSRDEHCLHGGDGPVCLAMTGENRYHSILGYHNCVRVHPSSVAPSLFALGAEIEVLRAADAATGKRTRLPIADLYPAEATAENPEHLLEPGDVITGVLLPAPAPGQVSAFRESREKLSFDWPTTTAAVSLTLEGGVIRSARICLGAVAPIPLPRPDAAALLVGQAPSDELFVRCAEAAFADAMPLAQNGYKVPVGKAVLRQALLAAAGMEAR